MKFLGNMPIEQIIDIVKEASALMVRSGFEVHDKGTRENLVTSSDVAVQKFLTEHLSALLPGSGFLCEEEDLDDLMHTFEELQDRFTADPDLELKLQEE